MIKTIEVQKLFDRFDYKIELKSEGITILTGPNGFGKSTILRMVNFASEGAFYKLNLLPFEKMIIGFDSGFEFKAEKTDKGIKLNGIELDLASDGKMVRALMQRRNADIKAPRLTAQEIFNFQRGLEQGKDVYTPSVLRAAVSAEELEEYDELTGVLKTELGQVKYIGEQRLLDKIEFAGARTKVADVIETVPQKLKAHIDDALSMYSNVSNKLDGTFPARLFKTKEGIDEAEFNENFKELISQHDKLKKYDFTKSETITNLTFQREHSKALKIFFADQKEKFKVFGEIIEKLDVFVEIVNEKMQFKKIKVDRERGLAVVDSGDESKTLKFSDLSSGERQIIVLYYELIFETDEDLLLLLDEPEISLHIAWQMQFLGDLKKIIAIKNKKINIVIATHSPQIINNNWDLQIDLGESYGG